MRLNSSLVFARRVKGIFIGGNAKSLTATLYRKALSKGKSRRLSAVRKSIKNVDYYSETVVTIRLNELKYN